MKLKEIVNLSGGFLSRLEFKDYISDYFLNYKEYKIDKRSRYYKEIKFCYNNIDKGYEMYFKLF